MIEQYGPYGSQCPENYSFQLEQGETIKEVIIGHGFIVDAIGFVVAKPCGGTYTKMFGGSCGNKSKVKLHSTNIHVFKITKLILICISSLIFIPSLMYRLYSSVVRK